MLPWVAVKVWWSQGQLLLCSCCKIVMGGGRNRALRILLLNRKRCLYRNQSRVGKHFFFPKYFNKTISGNLFSYNSQTEKATTSVHKAFAISASALKNIFLFIFLLWSEGKPTNKPKQKTFPCEAR